MTRYIDAESISRSASTFDDAATRASTAASSIEEAVRQLRFLLEDGYGGNGLQLLEALRHAEPLLQELTVLNEARKRSAPGAGLADALFREQLSRAKVPGKDHLYSIKEAEIDSWERERAALRAPQSAQQGEVVIDLEQLQWGRIKEAAAKAGLPPDYTMNDWVADVCQWLSAAPSAPAARGWAIKGPDGVIIESVSVHQTVSWRLGTMNLTHEEAITYGPSDKWECVPVLIVEDKR